MPSRIEDYAIIGDTHTAALVGRDGSIDWLCLPRFDSGACFAALLGGPDNGRWRIAPLGEPKRVTRRYRPGTLVLETEFEVDGGVVVVVDCMPERQQYPQVVRTVIGLRGQVEMSMELVLRFDYGMLVPWVRRIPHGIEAVAGPDKIRLHAPVKVRGENFKSVATFAVSRGERVPFVLTWLPSNVSAPTQANAAAAIERTTRSWKRWSKRCSSDGEYSEVIDRSLITLKALTYSPTGGIVAAATTSLPEQLGGTRNWDYRFCWLRDATFTLYALVSAGYHLEAAAWQKWLLRAAAGKPEQIQIMYGLAGERRLTELELPWLAGYEASRPVRIGNDAHGQRQLDVFGELMDALHLCRRVGIHATDAEWNLQRALTDYLGTIWSEPDMGIWEIRGAPQHFTHSKIMAWVALDRAVKGIEGFGLEGPLDKWKTLRDEIHADVCSRGYDARRGAFMQAYGSKNLDASLLLMPLVGFLPVTDARVRGTIAAIEKELLVDGFVRRYPTESGVDGLPPGEGVFLACTFWLADNLILMGRRDDARDIFERLLGLRNDVGLLAEEYDPVSKRQLGNFPQAFSHVSLANTARNLTGGKHVPARHRRG